MNCPKCKNVALQKNRVKSRNLELDRCPECKGLWFDENEFETLLGRKAHKELTVPAYAIEKHNESCPRCESILYEFCYPGTMTLVDVCKDCNGIWLDNNEWKEISAAKSSENQMYCPKCATRQIKSDSCIKCGIVFSKFAAMKETQSLQKKPEKKPDINETFDRESYARNIPGFKGRLLRFIDRSIENLTNY